MTEPDYLAQTGDVDTTSPEACRAWFTERRKDAWRMTWLRFSIDDEHKLLLVEGWKERPDDEGPKRFQFTTSTTTGKAGD